MEDEKRKCIYVASHPYTSLTKIGMSKSPTARLDSIKSVIGCALTVHYESPLLDNPREYEKQLHEVFKEHKSIGEWFNISPEEIIKYINTIEHTFNGSEYPVLYSSLLDDKPKIIELEDPYYGNLTKKKEFLYMDDNYNFYMSYKQSVFIKHIKFLEYRTALKFRNLNFDRLVIIPHGERNNKLE